MRGVDVLLAFPSMLLVILIVAAIGTGALPLVLGIGVAMSPVFARVVRATASREIEPRLRAGRARLGRAVASHHDRRDPAQHGRPASRAGVRDPVDLRRLRRRALLHRARHPAAARGLGLHGQGRPGVRLHRAHARRPAGPAHDGLRHRVQLRRRRPARRVRPATAVDETIQRHGRVAGRPGTAGRADRRLGDRHPRVPGAAGHPRRPDHGARRRGRLRRRRAVRRDPPRIEAELALDESTWTQYVTVPERHRPPRPRALVLRRRRRRLAAARQRSGHDRAHGRRDADRDRARRRDRDRRRDAARHVARHVDPRRHDAWVLAPVVRPRRDLDRGVRGLAAVAADARAIAEQPLLRADHELRADRLRAAGPYRTSTGRGSST